MRRSIAGLLGLLLALGVFAFVAAPARSAVSGYDSAYFGESAFLTLNPGETGQFVAAFNNTGTTGWIKGSASQVDLQICLADKTTCGVASPNAAWANNWLSSTAYATTSTDWVAPGQTGFFVYNVTAPSTSAGMTARFNGDLALHATGQQIHPQGYYQDAKVIGVASQLTCGAWTTNPIANNGTATTSTNVTVRDAAGAAVSSGSFSVNFSRSSGSSTVLVTASPQSTSGGSATFTVRSSGVAGTDTYRASATGLTTGVCPTLTAQ